MAMSCEAIGSA